jgi:hypothetical protein
MVTAGCASRQRPEPPAAGPGGGPSAADLASQARAAVSRSEDEPDAHVRAALVRQAVEAARHCEQLAPATPGCDYALAIALGIQARENLATAISALPEMVRLLRAAAQADPGLDFGGPNRVLAILLVRAPSWPLGPGDADEGLESARRAVALAPDHAPNQLALAEALRATGDEPGATAALQRAVGLSRRAVEAGEPEAGRWLRESERIRAGR